MRLAELKRVSYPETVAEAVRILAEETASPKASDFGAMESVSAPDTF